VSANVTIDAPPATVFAIVADPHQHPRIDGSASVRGIVEGPQRLTRGATFAMRMRLFGFPYRITNRVVEYEPDRLIAWRHFGAHRWRYELEALPGGGTRVTETFDYSRYRRWVHVLRLLRFPERNRRGIERTLPRLKATAEADARTSGSS
jgi:uncharacterized protein YndB with AHSA1/START domain